MAEKEALQDSLSEGCRISSVRPTPSQELAGEFLHQQALSYFPGTASMEDRVMASRSQLIVANIRWPLEALLGIRARQASRVSRCVSNDSLEVPADAAGTLPLEDEVDDDGEGVDVGEAGDDVDPGDGVEDVDEDGESVDLCPLVPLVSIPAHPIASIVKLNEAHKNNLEIGFIGQTPSSMDKQVGEYT